MASVRQADTALWLHNKLSTDDSWSGSSLRSLLTQDVLRNIPECFHRLETQVKVLVAHDPRPFASLSGVEPVYGNSTSVACVIQLVPWK